MTDRQFLCIEYPSPEADPREATVALGGPVKLAQLFEARDAAAPALIPVRSMKQSVRDP